MRYLRYYTKHSVCFSPDVQRENHILPYFTQELKCLTGRICSMLQDDNIVINLITPLDKAKSHIYD